MRGRTAVTEKRMRFILGLGLGAVVLFGSVTPSWAAAFLLRAGDLQVPAGTVVHGSAISVGGNAYITGTVEGDAIAFGGGVEVTGRVEGSARAVGGNVILRSTAVVDRGASAVGGTVYSEPGASVGGARAQPYLPPPGPPSHWGGAMPFPWVHHFPVESWPWGPVPFFMLQWLLLGFYLVVLASFVASAWLVAVLFPVLTARLAQLIERDPVGTLIAGILGWPLTVVLIVLLVFSVVGIPLAMLVPLALLAALQFGTTAVALLVGRRVRRSGMAQEVLVGAVILAIIFGIPHTVGTLAVLGVSTWGLGVVLLALLEARRSRASPSAGPPASPPA